MNCSLQLFSVVIIWKYERHKAKLRPAGFGSIKADDPEPLRSSGAQLGLDGS
jgi:hypothetical protein